MLMPEAKTTETVRHDSINLKMQLLQKTDLQLVKAVYIQLAAWFKLGFGYKGILG